MAKTDIFIPIDDVSKNGNEIVIRPDAPVFERDPGSRGFVRTGRISGGGSGSSGGVVSGPSSADLQAQARAQAEAQAKIDAEAKRRRVQAENIRRAKEISVQQAVRERTRIQSLQQKLASQGGQTRTQELIEARTGRPIKITTTTGRGGERVFVREDLESGKQTIKSFEKPKEGGVARKTGEVTVTPIGPKEIDRPPKRKVKTGEIQVAPDTNFFQDIKSFFTREKTGVKRRKVLEIQQVPGGKIESRITKVIEGVSQTELIFVPSGSGSERQVTPEERKEFRDKQVRVKPIAKPESFLQEVQFRVDTKRKIIETRRTREGQASGFKGVGEAVFIGGVGAGAASSLIGSVSFVGSAVTDPLGTAVRTKASLIQLSGEIVSGKTARDIALITTQNPGFALGFASTEILTDFAAGRVVRRVPKLARKAIKRLPDIVQFPTVDRALSRSSIVKGFKQTIDIDKLVDLDRKLLSEAGTRVVERRLGVELEPGVRNVVRRSIEKDLKLLGTPSTPKKPTGITFELDADFFKSRAATQEARLKTGTDLFILDDVGELKIRTASPRFKPKKPKPLTFELDKEFFQARIDTKKARLASGKDIIVLNKAGELSIKPSSPRFKTRTPRAINFNLDTEFFQSKIDAKKARLKSGVDRIILDKAGEFKIKPSSPRFKTKKPKGGITFEADADFFKSRIDAKKARLRSGADAVEIGKGGQVSIVETKQLQQLIPEVKLSPPKTPAIQKLAAQKFKTLNVEEIILESQTPKVIQSTKLVQKTRQQFDVGDRQKLTQSQKLLENQKLQTVQIQKTLQIERFAVFPLLRQSQPQRQRFRQNLQQVQKQEQNQKEVFGGLVIPKLAQQLNQSQVLDQRLAQGQKQRQGIGVFPELTKTPKPFPKTRTSKTPRVREFRDVEIFSLEIRRGGEFGVIGGDLTLNEALTIGAGRTRKTLARTFRVRPTGRKKKVSDVDEIFGEPDLTGFRQFKVRKGRRIAQTRTFIEEAPLALSTVSERKELQRARKQPLQLNGILNL